MTTKASTGLRNHVLATGSVKAALDSGFLEIYSGTEPATADAAIEASNVLLCRIYSDGAAAGLTLADAAVDGYLEKKADQSWTGTNVEAGIATFFRFVAPDDVGDMSTVAKRLQGSVGRAGADLNLSSVDLVVGAPQAVSFFSVAMPAF